MTSTTIIPHITRRRRPGAGALVAISAVAALTGCGSTEPSGSSGSTSTAVASSPSTSPPLSASVGAGAAEPATTPPATTPPTTAPPTTVPVTTVPANGWAIHEAVPSEFNAELVTYYDAVSCDSELGPWEIAVTFDVPGNVTHDIGFDITLQPDGTGTVTGTELSTWDDGVTVTGTSAGTATLTPDPPGFRLQFSYTENVNFSDGTTQVNDHERDLAVVPAAPGECPKSG